MKGDWRRFYFPLCRWLGPNRGGRAGGCGTGAPPGAERSATKDAARGGHRPRGPTLRAAPAPRGSPPAALRTQASGLSRGWRRPWAALSPTPGRRRESRSFPEAEGCRAASGDRASRGNSARFRGCPSPWPGHPAVGVQGPAGRPLPPPSLRSRAKVDFCSPSSSSSLLCLLFSSFHRLLSPAKGHTWPFLSSLSSFPSSCPPPLFPGDSAEKGGREGGMWVPL